MNNNKINNKIRNQINKINKRINNTLNKSTTYNQSINTQRTTAIRTTYQAEDNTKDANNTIRGPKMKNLHIATSESSSEGEIDE